MMKFRKATLNDINEIMEIEHQAFIKPIQETQETFENRIKAFSDGFYLLIDEQNSNKVAGYFSSEIWNNIPVDNNAFTLGHSALDVHKDTGSVLYISSVGLLDEYRGKHLGRSLFEVPFNEICTHKKTINKAILLVNEVWENARKIYESNEFITYGTIKEFFPVEKPDDEKKGTDGILMKKEW